ncbi:MFS transporter [Lactobacillus helveticus]|uniref:MFS transporter n=1 Tax=Lactobacillus helveticus TaxID=1587 RepID=UPI0021601C36|nr:MFS transporter [Lactobacillus helveticus]
MNLRNHSSLHKLFYSLPTPNSKKKNIKRILSDGIKFLINQHEIKWMVLSFLAANIGFQLIIPMLTFILKQRMHVSIDKISLLFTISSIASIIGDFIYLRYGKKIKLGLQLIAIGLLITLGFILMLDLKSFWLFLIGYAIVSFGSVWAQANFFTIIQSRTPNKYKGMVTSTSLTRITGPFIAILSGIIIKVSYELLFSLAILCMLLSIGITLLSKLYKLDYLK